jgi:hypothetical protein
MDDLRNFALELLETEKRYLLEDKGEYFAALVVVVTPEARYFEEVEFDDEEEKCAAYTGVVARAREQNATAIITINTSRQMSVADQDDLERYWWGQLETETEGVSKALVITISGPGMKAWCMSLPFAVRNSEVVLGEAADFEPAEIGLLPKWP